MAGSSTGEPPKNHKSEESDDLKKIRGIGIARQQWLSEIANIRTVRDLAHASAEQIEFQLNVEGHAVSRTEIEQWIAQARELTKESSPRKDDQGELSSKIEKPADIDTVAEQNLSPFVEEGESRTLASFIVEFQTKQVEGRSEQQTAVRHRESDSSETWSGIEGEQLQQWMLERAIATIQPEPVAKQPDATTTPLTVEITELRALQPPRTGIPMVVTQSGQGFSGFITSGEPFSLEVALRLTGQIAADIPQQTMTYCVQVYARHRATGEKTSLGQTQPHPLFAGQTSYTAKLSEITLQQPGMYRLQALVTLQGIRGIPGFLEVPLLQVL
ncbi:MAG: hypothetical protein VKL59_11810 [Nostocaceae cyanobacterium]|nr:hypothetical protein [Nostocaceae cyanobacterium]